MGLVASGGVFSRHNGVKAHHAIIQAVYALLVDLVALVHGQPSVHPFGTFEIMVGVMLVHQAHQLQVHLALALGFIIEP